MPGSKLNDIGESIKMIYGDRIGCPPYAIFFAVPDGLHVKGHGGIFIPSSTCTVNQWHWIEGACIETASNSEG